MPDRIIRNCPSSAGPVYQFDIAFFSNFTSQTMQKMMYDIAFTHNQYITILILNEEMHER